MFLTKELTFQASEKTRSVLQPSDLRLTCPAQLYCQYLGQNVFFVKCQIISNYIDNADLHSSHSSIQVVIGSINYPKLQHYALLR